jgi:hypothetical protein
MLEMELAAGTHEKTFRSTQSNCANTSREGMNTVESILQE